MILEVTLMAGAGYALPGYLQGRLRFPLHVNVTPVNDPPLLEILTAKVLRLAQVRYKRLYDIYNFPRDFCRAKKFSNESKSSKPRERN